MGDDTKRLSPGERWQPVASVLNGYQEAADYVRNLKAGGGALPGVTSAFQPAVVQIKNTTGSDLPRFSVLGIDTPIFTPTENLEAFRSRPAFKGVVPTVADHTRKFVVTLRPLPDDALGPAVLVGACPVMLKMTSETDAFATIDNGETRHLISGSEGAPILWADSEVNEDVSGRRWGLVNLISASGGKPATWYQLLTDLDSASIYYGYANPGTWDSDTGFLSDPHATDDPPISTNWSVLAVDGTGLQPCWAGDWVQAEPLSFEKNGYSCVMITRRASAQLQFWAVLGSDLYFQGATSAGVLINANWRSKTVWDGGLLTEGQYLPRYTTVIVTYFPESRAFFVTNAGCRATMTV